MPRGGITSPCPRCGAKSECLETRITPLGARRARRCHRCRINWSTVEVAASTLLPLLELANSVRTLQANLLSLPSAEQLADIRVSAEIRSYVPPPRKAR